VRLPLAEIELAALERAQIAGVVEGRAALEVGDALELDQELAAPFFTAAASSGSKSAK
jgi:hypothetical protein